MAFIVWVAMVFLMTWAIADSAFAEAPAMETTATPPVDVVTLKDGSIIYGEVIEMRGGMLQIKNSLAGDIIKVKWAVNAAYSQSTGNNHLRNVTMVGYAFDATRKR
ncbi:MAG TPA: hypothetical protein VFU48_09920 [Nitrospira sp.]|nr:hypothetical protein [Nitrospira sp.]